MINAIRALRLCQLAVVVCVLGMILITIPLSCIVVARHDVSVNDLMTSVGVVYGLFLTGALVSLMFGGMNL